MTRDTFELIIQRRAAAASNAMRKLIFSEASRFFLHLTEAHVAVPSSKIGKQSATFLPFCFWKTNIASPLDAFPCCYAFHISLTRRNFLPKMRSSALTNKNSFRAHVTFIIINFSFFAGGADEKLSREFFRFFFLVVGEKNTSRDQRWIHSFELHNEFGFALLRSTFACHCWDLFFSMIWAFIKKQQQA